MTKKLLTGVIAEEMYDYPKLEKLLSEGQKDADKEAVEQRIDCSLVRL